MMTPVKKIKFNHNGVLTSLIINIVYVVFSFTILKQINTTGNSDNSLLMYFLCCVILAINGLITFYKGVKISEEFIESCKEKTVADPNGIFHIKLTSSISFLMSDEENAKYRKIKDRIHLVTFIGSLLCGIILFIMLQSGCSLETFYTTGFIAFIGFLIFHIFVYFRGQEVKIN